MTPLLGSLYRAPNIYGPSAELSGALMQVARYKDNLLKDYYRLAHESTARIVAVNPPCVVIIGNAEKEFADASNQIATAKTESFELFRTGNKDVQVITYDELFRKVRVLVDLLEGKHEIVSVQ